MVLPPEVVGTWRPIHRTLDQAVKGLAADAGTVALPPVLLVQGYLVMERVVDRYVGPRRLVNQARLIFYTLVSSLLIISRFSPLVKKEMWFS